MRNLSPEFLRHSKFKSLLLRLDKQPFATWNRMIELIQHHSATLAALCRRFNVRRLDVFGSAAKGAFSAERSDLDFLVTLEANSPVEYADNYFGLAEALEKLFGRRVDLITEPSIRNPYFRQAVEQSRQLVYEA